MHATGHVIQYGPALKSGMIHIGGRVHAALLAFRIKDCDSAVKSVLDGGEIPARPAVRVRFDISLSDCKLLATRISLATKKVARATKHKFNPRMVARKKPAV